MTTHTTTRRHLLRQASLLAAPALLPFGLHAHGPMHGGAPRELVREQKPWGIAAAPREARRTVEIRMTDDMRFAPAHITVREGETLRLRAVNRGKVMHEIVIGTKTELDQHAEMMVKHPGMEHDEPYMAHVKPGQRGDIVWHFNRAGTFDFACLIAGHYQAGMTGTITVLPRAH